MTFIGILMDDQLIDVTPKEPIVVELHLILEVIEPEMCTLEHRHRVLSALKCRRDRDRESILYKQTEKYFLKRV